MGSQFYMPTRIHFGQGKIEQIGTIAGLYGKKAFVVTGKSSARKLGFSQTIEEKLKQAKIKPVFFEQVEPNPQVDTIEKGVSLFNEKRCDMIIALGGGSPLDAAKVIGILINNPGPVSRYFGKNKVKNDIPPLIAIPTTSGSGSEVTPYAVITDTADEGHLKKVMGDPGLFPREALIDPLLTLSAPPQLTSDAGIDALSHAVESFLSKNSFLLSETIALEAVRIIGEYLPRVLRQPENIEVRSYLMYAATLGGLAIAQTGATVMHAMGYPLVSKLGLPHGRVIGMLLPWFWEYSFPGNPEKFSTIIACLVKDAREYRLKGARESALLLKTFLHKSGLPSPSNVKIEKDLLSQFARKIATNKERIAVSPKKLDFQEVLAIYEKALSG